MYADVLEFANYKETEAMTDKKTEPKGISPAEMAEKTKAATTGKSAVTATTAKAKTDEKTMAMVPPTTDEDALKQANTLAAKIAKSGLFYHEDQVNGRNWVGAAGDPCDLSHRCRHTQLAEVEPQAGLEVRSGSNVFSIPLDFPRGLGGAGWFAVVDGGGKSLFA